MNGNVAAAPPWEWIQLALQVAVVVIGPLFGWLLKSVFDKIKDLERADQELADKVQELAVAIPTNYSTKAEITRQLDAIFNLLRDIQQKLDGKVDK